uniref:Pseudouridine synthase n=1 Tax=Leptospirillum ferriphilum TaxID=178606 RepID=A0A7C3LSI9_9BACT
MEKTLSSPNHEPELDQDGLVRLQKLLAHRGLASRRNAEEMIRGGLVRVNGSVVTVPGTKVHPETDQVTVDGKKVPVEAEPFLFLFYKPKGVVSTLHDPHGKTTLKDFFPQINPLIHVGRLDIQTEGVLLLTNNGDLAQRILHPRYEVPRTYLVKIQGVLSPAHLERLKTGKIRLDGRPVQPLELEQERLTQTNSWYRITLTEGRNREVRRLFDTLNYFVLKLTRIAFGNLDLSGLEPGEYRLVSPEEIDLLLSGARWKKKEPAASSISGRPDAARGRRKDTYGPRTQFSPRNGKEATHPDIPVSGEDFIPSQQDKFADRNESPNRFSGKTDRRSNHRREPESPLNKSGGKTFRPSTGRSRYATAGRDDNRSAPPREHRDHSSRPVNGRFQESSDRPEGKRFRPSTNRSRYATAGRDDNRSAPPREHREHSSRPSNGRFQESADRPEGKRFRPSTNRSRFATAGRDDNRSAPPREHRDHSSRPANGRFQGSRKQENRPSGTGYRPDHPLEEGFRRKPTGRSSNRREEPRETGDNHTRTFLSSGGNPRKRLPPRRPGSGSPRQPGKNHPHQS